MRNVFFFDTMLTPKVITFVFWLMLLVVAVTGLGFMFGGGLTFVKFLMGLLTIAGGAVGARIWCEILIVMFKIHENIKKLADKA
jgi:Domain of unknown function (DUF4282)